MRFHQKITRTRKNNNTSDQLRKTAHAFIRGEQIFQF